MSFRSAVSRPSCSVEIPNFFARKRLTLFARVFILCSVVAQRAKARCFRNETKRELLKVVLTQSETLSNIMSTLPNDPATSNQNGEKEIMAYVPFEKRTKTQQRLDVVNRLSVWIRIAAQDSAQVKMEQMSVHFGLHNAHVVAYVEQQEQFSIKCKKESFELAEQIGLVKHA